MEKGDQIQIPAEIAEERGIEPGWYGCRGIGNIDASYKVVGNVLQVVDAGDLADEDEGTVMAESPNHYDASNRVFNGTVLVNAEKPLTLEIVNNAIVKIL